METITIPSVVAILQGWGPFGIIILLWWLDTRNLFKIVEVNRVDTQQLMEDRRKETSGILDSYRSDVESVREMYRNNVKLVEGYEKLCGDLHDLVVLNISKLGILTEKIEQNEFCPIRRLRTGKTVQGDIT